MSDSDSLLTTTSTKPAFSAVGGRISALAKRGLTEETCQKWGYKVGDFNGKPVQVADYYDTSGCLVAQKLRFPTRTSCSWGTAEPQAFMVSSCGGTEARWW